MIFKLFTIQAFIALIILASSLTSSVNAAAIAPAGQFPSFGIVVQEGHWLTSNLGVSPEDSWSVSKPAASTPDNEKRLRKFLFHSASFTEKKLANFQPRFFPRGLYIGGRIALFTADRRSSGLSSSCCPVEGLCASLGDVSRKRRRRPPSSPTHHRRRRRR